MEPVALDLRPGFAQTSVVMHRTLLTLAALSLLSACTVRKVVVDDDDGGGGAAGAVGPASTTASGGLAVAGAGGGGTTGVGATGAGTTTTTTGGGTACASSGDCLSPDAPACIGGVCSPLPLGHPLGWGDGSPESVQLTTVFEPSSPREATDLEFHPSRPDELWVMMREYPSSQPCTQVAPTQAGCDALEGSIALITNPGSNSPTSQTLRDANGWHFMRRPPALAMGANDTWASCGEERTGNFMDDPVNFMGPTLWSSNLSVFGPHGPGGNGSHLDMLHASPYCTGIAHESANIYWVLNGHAGSLDRYDFAEPHVAGGHDHSDGAIWRYATGQLSRVPGVPSHMEYDDTDQHLYVADTGNERIVKLDTESGTPGADIVPDYDQISPSVTMNGAALSVVVPAGVLTAPSGLILRHGLLYVTDNATSQLHAFDKAGNLVRSLATGLPAGSLAGLEIGPDDRLYFVDKPTGSVLRIDPLDP